MEELDLKQLIDILWRKKLTIIIIVLIFAILGAVYSYNFVKPMYKSTSTIILGKVISSNGINLDNDVNQSQDSAEMISQSDLSINSSLIETYSELVKSKSLIEEVKKNLNINVETEELIKNISVSRVNNSDLLEVTAINENEVKAKEIVSEVVRIFSDKVKEIYNISNVYVIDEANISDEPYNINHIKDIIIFTIIGIFLSIVCILLYSLLDNTVKSSYEIENVLKLKTLITIPLEKKNKDELITIKESKAVISEAFRTLRTNVQFSSINSKGTKTLLITSCLPGEGKSYVSANLAVTFAQAGKKVILVDSDMRRGRQAKIFNVPNENGLSNYISNINSNGMELNWSLGKYIKETSINNLNLITAGNVPPNPAELLESERVEELIEELKKYYEIIIFDGAPILPITDSLLLARLLGKTMLVAVYNKTKKDNLLKAKNSVENVGGKIIGICLNKVSNNSSEYGDSYYYYSKPEEESIFSKKGKIVFDYKNKIKNVIKKIKTLHKRLNEGSQLEKRKDFIEINKSLNNSEKTNLEKKSKKDEEVLNNKVKHEEYIKNSNENKELKKAETLKKAEEKIQKNEKIQAEKAKKEMELAKKREEDKKIKEAERIVKQENKIKQLEERDIKRKENKEKRKVQMKNFIDKANLLKQKILNKKDKILEQIKIEKEKLNNKYEDYKIKRAEKNKIKREEKEIRDAELSKIREEQRIIMAKQKEEKRIEFEKRQEEERIRREEERIKKAEEKAIRDEKIAQERAIKEAEALRIKEEIRAKRELEKQKYAEEKAKKEAQLAEERAKKEAEILRIREEEKERKAREKEEARYTDEYLEENLYPKTKYNKF